MIFEPINWNRVNETDKMVWDKLKNQIWYPDEFAITNDVKKWKTFNREERWLFMRLFAGLTLLDTLQAEYGAPSLEVDARTKEERAVYKNIGFMEEIHAESYSYMFQTLGATDEMDAAFRWAAENPELQAKAALIHSYYMGDDPLKKRIVSSLLESFLFFTGFWYILYLNGYHQKLTNCGDCVRAIIKDETIHGFYIGLKFQDLFSELDAQKKEYYQDWASEKVDELYAIEVKYTQDLFDSFGLTEDVKKFVRWNGNKALQNLGFTALFVHEDLDPVIENQLNIEGVTKDIFTGKSNYSKIKESAIDDSFFDDLDDM